MDTKGPQPQQKVAHVTHTHSVVHYPAEQLTTLQAHPLEVMLQVCLQGVRAAESVAALEYWGAPQHCSIS